MLNIKHINLIEKQVLSAGISYSHLADDLIDHICCDVESRMNYGESFEQAFEKVKDNIGIEGLKNIENQTLLFINQSYLIMKKSLNVLSVVSASLIILSGIMKIMHLPGAGITLSLAFMSLIFGFIPLLFLTRNKEDTERKLVWVNLSGFIASVVFLLSILWTIMHWPGKTWLVVLSWILILGFFVPSYMMITLKSRNDEKRVTNIGVILLILFLMVLEIVLNLNNRQSAFTRQDTVVNNLPEMTEYFSHQNAQSYAKLEGDQTLSDDERRRLNLLKEKSHEFEYELLDLATELENLNDFNSIRLKDRKPADFEERIEKLRVLSLNYREAVEKEFSLTGDMKRLVEITCDTKGSDEMSIYELYFSKPAFMIRNNLFRLNRDLLLIENELLESFNKQT